MQMETPFVVGGQMINWESKAFPAILNEVNYLAILLPLASFMSIWRWCCLNIHSYYVLKCIHTYIHTYLHTYIHTYIHMRACMHARVHTHTLLTHTHYIHTHTTHTHTHIHAHTHSDFGDYRPLAINWGMKLLKLLFKTFYSAAF